MAGIVVIDKPSGPTSHDIVARVRKKLRTREVGHAGTLDPMATGILVIAVGEATKLVPWLSASDKSYEATIRLGVATDTLDALGKETARAPVPSDLAGRLPEALGAERARTEQVPPAFSAIRSRGKRAYERARLGEEVALEPRDVAVRSLELVQLDAEYIHLRLTVSKGYYVRALARDLASALGTVGHLTRLRRTRAGDFTLADARDVEDVLALIPLATAASRALPAITLSDSGVLDAKNGRPVALADMSQKTKGPCAWLDGSGALIAVGEIVAGAGKVLRGFRRA